MAKKYTIGVEYKESVKINTKKIDIKVTATPLHFQMYNKTLIFKVTPHLDSADTVLWFDIARINSNNLTITRLWASELGEYIDLYDTQGDDMSLENHAKCRVAMTLAGIIPLLKLTPVEYGEIKSSFMDYWLEKI